MSRRTRLVSSFLSLITSHFSLANGVSALNICPCCGASLEGVKGEGCAGCGARPVGPPLARPERVLPGYGHALAATAAGLSMLAALLVSTAGALFGFEEFSLSPKALLR